MINRIHIEGIRLYAFHGCLEEEARIGGHYIVDVFIGLDFSHAAKTDELGDTVDYCGVYAVCRDEMAVRSKLIEHVCRRIHDRLRVTFPLIGNLRVRVTKLNPPIGGDAAQVSVETED
jgi:7,8-dihydroneopterin aldolase/epimerase/oxygenase